MAQFTKGKSGNPKGRPKGSKNEKTECIRQWVLQLISTNAKDLLKDFQSLSLEQQWKVIATLLPYAIPKQQETKISGDIDLNSLSDEQLERLVEGLANKVLEDDNGN